ncbi:hypothetical protein ACKAWT_09885 [Xanthomonas vasicola]|nr:hypothetical protein [Xanthomonas vasicola]MDO6933542.1 hypothetical protein [Xanthomonas vasicola]MDO6947844.1 hypothetical protein [Xanthomonas vasicola]MDO6951857.1 hypothetical protein [Xanthomonas vasicola]MDO6955878.1 hypothetical protein [Xanthomonas vasicola]MDO6959877.1 hypothetical protein [Xanthomonas vasicola]
MNHATWMRSHRACRKVRAQNVMHESRKYFQANAFLILSYLPKIQHYEKIAIELINGMCMTYCTAIIQRHLKYPNNFSGTPYSTTAFSGAATYAQTAYNKDNQ